VYKEHNFIYVLETDNKGKNVEISRTSNQDIDVLLEDRTSKNTKRVINVAKSWLDAFTVNTVKVQPRLQPIFNFNNSTCYIRKPSSSTVQCSINFFLMYFIILYFSLNIYVKQSKDKHGFE